MWGAVACLENFMQIVTSFRSAFDKATGQVNIKNFGKLGSSIRQAQQRDAGKRLVPSWNAHLSFRTFDKLSKAGVPVGAAE